MLKDLLKKREALMARFEQVNENEINDAELRAKFRKLKAKQGGFTLLELLVVVAILAAIAGTAAIALQDTDARASAAAHVAMMDELNKGIRTFRVLNKNEYPNRFDSLLERADAATVSTANAFAGGALGAPTSVLGFEDSLSTVELNAGVLGGLNDIGITSMMYISNEDRASADLDGDGTTTDCASATLQATIASRSNAVVANNIFMSNEANGCGIDVTLAATDRVAIWTGGYERVLGGDGTQWDATTIATDGTDITAGVAGAPVLMVVGLGPSSNLFNANELGGMTTVPVYRHVSETQYGRFVALFEIGTVPATPAAGTDFNTTDQVNLVAIVDGAGDTKEEELGEWDGTRNTI